MLKAELYFFPINQKTKKHVHERERIFSVLLNKIFTESLPQFHKYEINNRNINCYEHLALTSCVLIISYKSNLMLVQI